MTYIVRHRMGLPIWEEDRVVGTKHFYETSTITDEDFEEARQDDEQKAELLSYNTYTPEQWDAKQRLDQINQEIAPLEAVAHTVAEYDWEKMTIFVPDAETERYAETMRQIAALTREKKQLQEVLDDNAQI